MIQRRATREEIQSSAKGKLGGGPPPLRYEIIQTLSLFASVPYIKKYID